MNLPTPPRYFVFVALALTYLACSSPGPSPETEAPAPQLLTTAEWTADLDTLYHRLCTVHRNPYHVTDSATLARRYRDIRAELPRLSDPAIITRFASLVAQVRDGHTRLTLPLAEGWGLGQAHSNTPPPVDTALVFRALPVTFYGFAEGLYILRATESYRHLIGRRVLAFDGVPAAEALERARSVAHYENEMGYRLVAAAYLGIFEVLRSLGLASAKDRVTLTLDGEAKPAAVTLSPLPRSPAVRLTGPFDGADAFFTRTRHEEYYWFEYQSENRTVYWQLNQMNNAPEGPGLISFLGELDSLLSQQPVERLVLDLRQNFGGDNTYVTAIVRLLLEHPRLQGMGGTYVLIGRKTFSAAQSLVNDLSKWTNAVFVGEPTGAKPSSFGDSRKIQLPHSGLTVRIATIYWPDGTGNETRPWTTPDIPAPPQAAAFFAGKDPAWAACRAFPATAPLAERYARLYETGGLATAKRFYVHLALDWNRDPADFVAVEERLVRWLAAEGE